MSDSGETSPEEFEPKHRIAGAIVLVLLAVIFLPMLLEDKPTPPVDGAEEIVEIPETADQKVFVSRVKPLSEAESKKPAPAEKKAPAKPAKRPAKPAAKKAKSAAKELSEGWVVRIGTFAEKDNVQRAVAKLKSAGFTPHTETINSGEAQATRVWVGPFASRAKASTQRSRILKKTGFEGLVVSYP